VVSFRPDYFEHPSILDGELVFCLVLGFSGQPIGGREVDCGIVLRCLDQTLQLYERLGFVSAWKASGGFGVFPSSKVTTVNLV